MRTVNVILRYTYHEVLISIKTIFIDINSSHGGNLEIAIL